MGRKKPIPDDPKRSAAVRVAHRILRNQRFVASHLEFSEKGFQGESLSSNCHCEE
jgi:hypothetical protein